ncbi:TetR/AcrR family transcriptional regulator [Nocardia mexicana]|uniref:TetR family transcriptional regulator n=2 Tax=Nocardia mexicana TaxID=279262 RepID=A0A370H1M3_9NOCA|nr:TetR/AcrR family transcriptional regulator [Nocardia mexicana]RDI49919.1 TetR family transcriptional regulator [Nocardia mexicana]
MVDTLLEAAAQVFSREGMAATTNRIAERAGVSIGTLYQYFPNKQALLRMLAERHLAEAGARLGEVFAELRATHPPFEETMHAVIDTVVELHADRPALHALMHRLAPRVPAEWNALQEFEDHLVTEVAYHLDRCGRGGDDTELTARTLVHTIDAQVHRVLPRHRLGTEQVVALTLRLTPETPR